MRFLTKTDNPRLQAIAITSFCVILVSAGQALMKYGFNQGSIPGSMEFSKDFFHSFFSSFILTPWIVTGYLLATVSSVLFLEALHKTEFGITAAVLRLNYIVAYFIGVFYFGETYKTVNLVGLLLIFAGVVIISLSEDSTSSC